MRAIILGSAAGGGFPQWNCACPNCTRARAGDPAAPARTQVSLAVTQDAESYLLIGASPDLREQIAKTPALTPRSARHSPIAEVLILSGDIDGIMGLLHLREGHQFTLYAPPEILKILEENTIFNVLNPQNVKRIAISPGEEMQTSLGLKIEILPFPGKTPLYYETPGIQIAEPAPAYAAKITDPDGKVLIMAPACAEITDAVFAALIPADLIFFDGTLFDDNEMITAGLSQKTSRRMGHVPLTGTGGSLERLKSLPARQKAYLHINNSNPILCADTPQRAAVEAENLIVTEDGMVFDA